MCRRMRVPILLARIRGGTVVGMFFLHRSNGAELCNVTMEYVTSVRAPRKVAGLKRQNGAAPFWPTYTCR